MTYDELRVQLRDLVDEWDGYRERAVEDGRTGAEAAELGYHLVAYRLRKMVEQAPSR